MNAGPLDAQERGNRVVRLRMRTAVLLAALLVGSWLITAIALISPRTALVDDAATSSDAASDVEEVDDGERTSTSARTPTSTPTTPAPTTTMPTTTTEPPLDRDLLTASPEIVIRDQPNVLIENMHVTNPDGNCITIFDSSNVTIRNSVIGPCGGDAVYGIRVTNGLVENLEIESVERGVIFVRSETVKVQDNRLTNAGSYFVQFNNVNGAGNRILRNRGDNELGNSPALDMISLFASNGLPSDPIQVIGNYIRGGGPSTIGSGIMTGDNGGSYQLVQGNVLVNPGQAGIGVSGGHDISVVDNQVFSATHPWGNLGIAAFNHRDFSCSNVEIRDNQVKWTNKNDDPNPWWTDGHCGSIAGLDTNDFDADLSEAIW